MSPTRSLVLSKLLRIYVHVYQSVRQSVSVPTRAFVPRSTQYLRIFPWILYGNGSFRTFWSWMLPGPTMFQDTSSLSKESRKTNLESRKTFIFPVWPKSDAREFIPRLYYTTIMYDLWIKSFRLLALPISFCLRKTFLITSLSFLLTLLVWSTIWREIFIINFRFRIARACCRQSYHYSTRPLHLRFLRIPSLERRFKSYGYRFRFLSTLSLRNPTWTSWRSLRSLQVRLLLSSFSRFHSLDVINLGSGHNDA